MAELATRVKKGRCKCEPRGCGELSLESGPRRYSRCQWPRQRRLHARTTAKASRMSPRRRKHYSRPPGATKQRPNGSRSTTLSWLESRQRPTATRATRAVFPAPVLVAPVERAATRLIPAGARERAREARMTRPPVCRTGPRLPAPARPAPARPHRRPRAARRPYPLLARCRPVQCLRVQCLRVRCRLVLCHLARPAQV